MIHTSLSAPRELRVGMAGFGMIFDDTYLPVFRLREPLYSLPTGPFTLRLVGAASRTGSRSQRFLDDPAKPLGSFQNLTGGDSAMRLAALPLDAICVATPDNRHFEPVQAALAAGKHVLVEKPSVLSLSELDELCELAEQNGVLAKVVYHKLADPDHKKLRTLVVDGVLRHVNNGYCSLLEPKSISGGQFAEWITGRNPATYVAVHYLKLIDFTFGPELVA